MSLSRPFILRPVATTLLMVALLLAGVLAYRLLPVAALPQVDYPIIQITTLYPGASPELTTRTITAPLERQLGQIPGLKQLSSTSSGGASVITLQFGLDVSLGVAEQDVQAAINAAGSFLPDDLPIPPVYRKVNPADTPILTLAVTSQGLSLPQVHDLVDTRIAQRLSQLPGVGLVSLAGGQRPAVRIQVNPAALAANNLGMDHIRSAIAAANVNLPKGSFDGPMRAVMLDANDQMRSVAEYRALVLSWRDGAPLRLGDVATITDGAENRQLAAWTGTTPAVLVNIQRQPGANVIAVVEQVRALLPQLQASLPGGVEMKVLSDRTESIRASVRGVQKELVLAIALVVLVTWVFLRNIPATIIPTVAVPLSLVGTFAVMLLAGFSLNNLTLMALTIATGFVVDDAIVMLENIARHLEEGESPRDAALKGASEIGFTLVSLTVSLIAVLIPLLFMADLVGALFHEFAITLAVAIGISLVVSLTLTPMLCARFLKPHAKQAASGPDIHGDPAQAAKPDVFDRIIAVYDRQLHWVLQRQPLMLVATVATLLLTVGLYLAVPKGFFPVQDAGLVQGISEAPQAISFQAMRERQLALASAIEQDPAVASLSSYIGVDGNNATLNTGRLLIELKPHGQRSDDIATVMARLQQRVAKVPGISLYLQPVQELGIEDRISRSQYQFTLTTPALETLEAWTPKLLQALQQAPALRDVASDLQMQGRQARVVIDRDAAARLNVSVEAVADALYDAYGQRQISTIFTQASQYRVVLEADPSRQPGPDAIAGLRVRNSEGQTVPLGAVARVEQGPAALLRNHVGQFPAATLSFNLAPAASLGEAVAAVHAARAQVGLPDSIELRLQGAAAAFSSSLSSTLWLILAAVVVMYIVLGVLWSFIHPATILSTLPSATVGALAALWVSGRSLDLIAVIGIILLIGLVKKNAIMMIDFALDAQRTRGMAPREAIHQAALMRFRPILMTTLAALFGAIPLMLASGSGAELRQPLGWVMVGGLLVSQVLTLFTTPVIYLAFDRLQRRRAQPVVGASTDGHAHEPAGAHRAGLRAAPVATTLLAVALVLAGLLALRLLPVAPLPQVDYPAIEVSASLPGASPESMAATVATPLERALGSIPGITRIDSASTQGQTSVELKFSLGRDIDEAAREVQAAINIARGQLPSGMPGMPEYRKVNPSQAPILALALTSDVLSPGQLYDLGSTVLAQKLSQIPGVGEVQVGGSALPAVRVSLDPNALNHAGLALEDVAQAIGRANAVRPLGAVGDARQQWQLEAPLQLRGASQYRELALKVSDDRPLRLGDVAHVEDGVEDRYASGFHNERPAVLLIVSRQPGANIIATVDAIQAQLPQLHALLPANVDMRLVMDRSPVIRATLHEAEITLVLAIVLVVLVVLGFLGHWRAALVPSLAIPVVLFGALALIALQGFSLNTLSLMALIVAAVLVVDDAIVVLENIARHCELGADRWQAAVRGASEVGATLVSMNVALAVVFVSILFLDDFVERLFREFSLTLVAAMAVSVLVALSLVPMLCARLLVDAAQQPSRWQRWSNAAFERVRGAYLRSLQASLRRLRWPLLAFVAVIALNAWLFQQVPKGVVPKQDTAQLRGFARGDDGLSFQAMQPKIDAYRKLLLADPAIEDIIGYIGGSNGVNNAFIMIKMKPLAERQVSSQQVIDRLRANLPKLPGGNLFMWVDQDIRLEGSGSSGQYEFQLLSADLAPLREWAPKVSAALRDLPELVDVEAQGEAGMRQVVLDIDREAAARHGVDLKTVATVLNNSFSQRQVATLYDSLNQYRVVMELDPRHTQDPTTLEQLQVVDGNGQRIPLSSIAQWRYGMAPDRVYHSQQFASIWIEFALAPGVGLEQATRAINEAMAKVMLPRTVQAKLSGEAGGLEQLRQRQLWLVLGATLAVYLVLGILYESFLQPLVILSTLPSAGIGALLALWGFGSELNLIALLGLFLLVGVVMKNTILLVDFALAGERRGLSADAAVLEAARLRLRPILMTSVAALLGTLPLMIGGGEGWELRRPLGIAIVGGLLVSQWLTLYTTPAMYLALARLRARHVAPAPVTL